MPIYEYETQTDPPMRLTVFHEIQPTPGSSHESLAGPLILQPDQTFRDRSGRIWKRVVSRFLFTNSSQDWTPGAAHSESEWTRYWASQMDVPDQTGQTPHDRIRSGELVTEADSSWFGDKEHDRAAEIAKQQAYKDAEYDKAIEADFAELQLAG